MVSGVVKTAGHRLVEGGLKFRSRDTGVTRTWLSLGTALTDVQAGLPAGEAIAIRLMVQLFNYELDMKS